MKPFISDVVALVAIALVILGFMALMECTHKPDDFNASPFLFSPRDKM